MITIGSLIAEGEVDYARLLIGDDQGVLADEQIALLILRAGSTLLGAADALDAIASSEVMLSKKITTQDLATDGPAVAAELRKQAAALRARAKTEAAQVSEEAWGFTTAPSFTTGDRPELTEGRWLP